LVNSRGVLSDVAFIIDLFSINSRGCKQVYAMKHES
jgi:hypothetical protein